MAALGGTFGITYLAHCHRAPTHERTLATPSPAHPHFPNDIVIVLGTAGMVTMCIIANVGTCAGKRTRTYVCVCVCACAAVWMRGVYAIATAARAKFLLPGL